MPGFRDWRCYFIYRRSEKVTLFVRFNPTKVFEKCLVFLILKRVY